MSKKFISVQNITDPKILASKLEIVIRDLYDLISKITPAVSSGAVPLYISTTVPTGTITNGSIWVNTSTSQAYVYVVSTWVPFAGS